MVLNRRMDTKIHQKVNLESKKLESKKEEATN
jgi:hypothetical protein